MLSIMLSQHHRRNIVSRTAIAFDRWCFSSLDMTLAARDRLRTLSSLRGLRGAPEVPPLCRETQSLGQHMLERW